MARNNSRHAGSGLVHTLIMINHKDHKLLSANKGVEDSVFNDAQHRSWLEE